jgi:hypothetical protein
MTSVRSVSVSLALLLAGAAGCADRLHMTPGHGRSVQAAFSAQQSNPQAGKSAKPLPGLDAQEAKIVSGNYRRSLVAKDAAPQDQGLVLVAPAAQPAQPYVPPPSVPEQK